MNRRTYIFRKNQKLNSRIVYEGQTLKNINFSFKKQRISCVLSVILYGIFAIFTFFHFIQKSSKKSVVPSNIAWKENLKNCTFSPFWRIFTIFKETSLLRDDPKSSEMDEMIVSACIENINLIRNTKIDCFLQ